MKVRDLVPDAWSSSTDLVPGNMYSAKDTAKAIDAKKVKPKTITVKNNSTGEIIGKRTTMSK